jgi:hypothetical protein
LDERPDEDKLSTLARDVIKSCCDTIAAVMSKNPSDDLEDLWDRFNQWIESLCGPAFNENGLDEYVLCTGFQFTRRARDLADQGTSAATPTRSGAAAPRAAARRVPLPPPPVDRYRSFWSDRDDVEEPRPAGMGDAAEDDGKMGGEVGVDGSPPPPDPPASEATGSSSAVVRVAFTASPSHTRTRSRTLTHSRTHCLHAGERRRRGFVSTTAES